MDMKTARDAEIRLQDHLLGLPGTAWFVTTRLGTDDAGRYAIEVRHTSEGTDDAQSWIDSRGGTWEGIPIRAVRNPGF